MSKSEKQLQYYKQFGQAKSEKCKQQFSDLLKVVTYDKL